MYTEPTQVENPEKIHKSKSEASVEEEEEEEELNDSLFVTFICTSDTSIQLIMDLSADIVEALKALYPPDIEQQQ